MSHIRRPYATAEKDCKSAAAQRWQETGKRFAAYFSGVSSNSTFDKLRMTTGTLGRFVIRRDSRSCRDYNGSMKLTYDLRHDIAYLRIREKPATVETVHVSDDLNVEVALDGTVCGIEFLKAQQQLAGTDHGQFVFVDEAKGSERKVPLSPAPSLVIQGAPLWQLKMRGTPLSEQQEVVLRLRDEEKLTHQEIAERVGVSLLRVRKLYETGKALRKDYARKGVESLLLLPTLVRNALEKLELASRARVKAAIAARELGWDKKLNRLIHPKDVYGINLGRESWLLLLEWVSDDCGKSR